MKKVGRKKSLVEGMILPRQCGPFACCLKLETDSILLMKLRSIFRVSSDEDLSSSICKHLYEFTRDEEQKDLERRAKEMDAKNS